MVARPASEFVCLLACSQARSAALCLVETRTPLGLAARFSLQHRSLYPRVASARDHYVFTSHADRPMCVWDLRKMSVPLFEQDRLDNMQRVSDLRGCEFVCVCVPCGTHSPTYSACVAYGALMAHVRLAPVAYACACVCVLYLYL